MSDSTSDYQAGPLPGGNPFPLLVTPHKPAPAPAWLTANREFVREALDQYGAVLLRGFKVDGAAGLEKSTIAMSGESWVEYREVMTPRSQVEGHVFTSTDYPARRTIYPHNENSHVTSWPMKLFFYCDKAPESGGETPLVDCRRLLSRLTDETVAEFRKRGLMYRRNFGYMGYPWRQAYNVDSKEQLEEYAAANYMVPDFIDDDKMTMRYVRWVMLDHPRTGERVWFNHGTFFNLLTQEPAIRRIYVARYGESGMPYHSYYGDGEPIPEKTIMELDAAYEAESTTFPWQNGDLLIVDNMLVAHGRRPYTGDRNVLVAMSERMRCEEIARPEDYRPTAACFPSSRT